VRILVDADSFPVRLRRIVIRQADRRGFAACFYSNSPLPLPANGVESRVVDDADDAMVADAQPGDLAITHDVPLAARLVEVGATVLDERGGRFTRENVGQRLSERNFATDLRNAGVIAERNRPPGPREVQGFANALDRELTRRLNS
jgi:uncharacterized protein YaiI (UPF0178 family)